VLNLHYADRRSELDGAFIALVPHDQPQRVDTISMEAELLPQGWHH